MTITVSIRKHVLTCKTLDEASRLAVRANLRGLPVIVKVGDVVVMRSGRK